jgi:hypothetical protein
MPSPEMQVADAQARVTLPAMFAEAAVTVEIVSPSEIRIRKVGSADDFSPALAEESSAVLSNRDRDRFLELIDSPPPANVALRQAMAEHQRRNG